jgi:hypothetical protein
LWHARIKVVNIGCIGVSVRMRNHLKLDHFILNTLVHGENSIVKSSWIANTMINKCRAQPNMPVKAILGEVKDKWGVDV